MVLSEKGGKGGVRMGGNWENDARKGGWRIALIDVKTPQYDAYT